MDAIRSWKTDLCTRKVNVKFAPFTDAFDTAEALFSVRDRVSHDVVRVAMRRSSSLTRVHVADH